MTEATVNPTSDTCLRQKSVPASSSPFASPATIEMVLGLLEEDREILSELATVLVERLTPANPHHPPDDWPIVAWRLTQAVQRHLQDRELLQDCGKTLLGVREWEAWRERRLSGAPMRD